MTLQRVKGHSDFSKHVEVGSIVNTNQDEYRIHLERKAKERDLNKRLSSLESTFESVKSDIESVKSDLATIVNMFSNLKQDPRL